MLEIERATDRQTETDRDRQTDRQTDRDNASPTQYRRVSNCFTSPIPGRLRVQRAAGVCYWLNSSRGAPTGATTRRDKPHTASLEYSNGVPAADPGYPVGTASSTAKRQTECTGVTFQGVIYRKQRQFAVWPGGGMKNTNNK